MHRSFLRPLFYAALLFGNIAWSYAQAFQGNFDLFKIMTKGRSLPLTKTQQAYSFNIHRLSETPDGSLYSFRFVIDNIITGTILVDETSGKVISTDPIGSTRMRQGDDEWAVMQILRSLKTLKKMDTRVLLKGTQGTIVLKHQIIYN